MHNISLPKVIFVTTVLAVAAPESSLAEWKFTRWGMSLEQALEAANQQAERLIPLQENMADRYGNVSLLSFDNTRIIGIDFSGTLDFRKTDGKLMRVRLCVSDAFLFGDYERRMVMDELERSLGHPSKIEHTSSRTLATWHDPARNNIITASLALPDASDRLPSCLIYEPIRPPSDF